ncbi:uroporphyrinogen decarboxylase family protein [Candidatus Latescibacterota bacterium]
MTPRERVLAAIEHQESDRIPIDFGGHRSSGIMAMAYARLKETLGIHTGDIYVYDVIQQLAIVEPDVADAVGADAVELGRAFMTGDGEWKDWQLPDGTPCKIPAYVELERRGGDWYLLGADGTDYGIQKQGCLYFEQTHFPLMERGVDGDDFGDLADRLGESMWTGTATPGGHFPLDDAGLERLAQGAAALRAGTDRAIIGLFGGNVFEIPQFLYRIDNHLAHMALYPEAVRRLVAALADLHMAHLEKFLGAVGEHIDIILFGDDLGGQNGPLISPRMYREFCKPHHARLWRRAKELADVKVMLHSCGGIEPLLDDLIDAGLDTTNPVQTTCSGMDPRHLKDTYGDRLCFWGGGCDTRDVLPNGTPDQVRDHVREQCDILGPGGGLRVPAGPQHHGRCAGRERGGHVRGRPRKLTTGRRNS